MGRPVKLDQRAEAEIGRRLATGESMTSLAREFKVSKALLSQKFSKRVPEIKKLAQDLASVEINIATLGVSEQASIRTLADQIRSIQDSLLKVAATGGRTAEILAGAAERRAGLLGDEPDPDALRMVVGLVQGSNQAVSTGLTLVTTNREKPSDVRENNDLCARLAEAEARAKAQPSQARQELRTRLLEARQKLQGGK